MVESYNGLEEMSDQKQCLQDSEWNMDHEQERIRDPKSNGESLVIIKNEAQKRTSRPVSDNREWNTDHDQKQITRHLKQIGETPFIMKSEEQKLCHHGSNHGHRHNNPIDATMAEPAFPKVTHIASLMYNLDGHLISELVTGLQASSLNLAHHQDFKKSSSQIVCFHSYTCNNYVCK